MRKKLLSICTVAVLSVTMLAGCGDNAVETSTEPTEIEIEAETEETEETEAEAEADAEAEETEETEEEIEEAEAEAEVEAEETEVSVKAADVEEVEEEPVVETVVPVHTHSYTLTASTVGANCVSGGVDTYTCSCGDSYTVANANVGAHTWTTESYSETVHHDAVVEAQRGYLCDCGIFWPLTGDLSHPVDCGYTTSCRDIEVSPAYDEVVNHSRTYCTSCGVQQ